MCRRDRPSEYRVPTRFPNLAVMPEAALRDRPPAGLGITCITRDGAETHIQHWSKCPRDSEAADEEDPFELEDGGFCEPAEEYEEDNEEADSDEEVEDAAFEAEMKHINACLEKEGMPLLVEKFRTNLARRFPARQQDAILAASLEQKTLEMMPVNEYVDLYVI